MIDRRTLCGAAMGIAAMSALSACGGQEGGSQGGAETVPASWLKCRVGKLSEIEFPSANTHELLVFTNKSQVYKCKVAAFEDTKSAQLGSYLATDLEMDPDESVIWVIDPDAAGASVFNPQGAIVAAITLLAAVIFSGRGGIVGTVPVLLAIVVGYAVAIAFGMVDFAPIAEAAWVGLPNVSFPKFDMGAIALIAPVAVVTVIEHIGHLLAVGEIVDKDYRPLLPRSLAGDGLSTMISGFLGGPPTTTYAENIGVMSVTRVYSTQIFWYAGGFALIVGGLCPKLAALINSIPSPVMGGVCLLLFGLIASNGLRMLVSNGVDFDVNRNLMIASVVIILGVGMETSGIAIPLGDYTLPGMATSTLVGIILNLVLPQEKKGEARA